MPTAVAIECKHHLRRLGITETECARQIGLSQGSLSNALRGHDPLSGRTAARLRDVLLSKQPVSMLCKFL
jgi:hypothetical protein